MRSLTLSVLTDTYSVCRLPADALIPDCLSTCPSEFCSVTRTADELSIVCASRLVTADAASEPGWRCLKVAGPLDFEMVGVMADLTRTLAEAQISVFVVSTYETDYVLVRAECLSAAIQTLRSSGHTILR